MNIGFNNSPNKPAKPKFQVGDVIGVFKVLAYLGHHDSHGKHVRAEHVYKAECMNCGAVHERRQNMFRKAGTRCKKCPTTKPKPKVEEKVWATDEEALQIARACKW